ncbi:hypothetical protein [Paraburkholderia sp. J7]|uniref:hypothetical protein n=1 Tax=Paraburkholderia sp. J7 TaxID=2805438 RepID=UPI002AB66353|nr:hypothetical protein [Paraburkholderia sp. J7]
MSNSLFVISSASIVRCLPVALVLRPDQVEELLLIFDSLDAEFPLFEAIAIQPDIRCVNPHLLDSAGTSHVMYPDILSFQESIVRKSQHEGGSAPGSR